MNDRLKRAPFTALWWWLPVLLSAAFAATAGDSQRYAQAGASPGGTGKIYLGREIAQIMSFHGAAWLERPERMAQEQSDRILAEFALTPGMTIADIGAGSGYYTWRAAERVGPTGTVYAVDVQPEMLKLLEAQMSRRRISNVKSVPGTATDPRLPADSLDVAFMVDVYHEFEFPYEMLAALVRSLKPGGRLVFVEYRANDPNVQIKPLHTMSEAQVKKEASAQALEWVKSVTTLPLQNVIVFRKK